MLDKCTAATSTEELMTYSCVEVQTTPYDTPESESESNDEPIENLSLLTKELLNRTELQERIAENINKAILPTDTSLKDESLNDSMNGEANTSIMIELNNAIKSIVEATESDPVFEKFLEEIIGPHMETDTSPDEDIEAKSKTKIFNELQEKQSEMISNNNSLESIILDAKSSSELNAADIPLKHRLRSSFKQQNTRNEDEQCDQEKEDDILEDQNAAAISSIINANIINKKSINDKKIVDTTKEIICLLDNDSEKELPIFEIPIDKDTEKIEKLITNDIQKDDTVDHIVIQNNDMESKMKKSSVKRLRLTKLKQQKSESNINNYTTEQDQCIHIFLFFIILYIIIVVVVVVAIIIVIFIIVVIVLVIILIIINIGVFTIVHFDQFKNNKIGGKIS
ncbi:WRKY transcription factor protein 1 [Apis mellifera caucasica]|nr:WRKY transcription factor protein 1 [Apis mellifera caucasica]KAG9432773.1 WRKY transcription factor protein 1 [Apis mellifera carnica]